MSDDGHAPGLPQNLLPLLPVHVPHVSVVFGKPKDPGDEDDQFTQLSRVRPLGKPQRHPPFQLGDPEDGLSAVVQDRQQRHVLSLFQRVRVGGDGPHFGHLGHKQHDGEGGNPGDGTRFLSVSAGADGPWPLCRSPNSPAASACPFERPRWV